MDKSVRLKVLVAAGVLAVSGIIGYSVNHDNPATGPETASQQAGLPLPASTVRQSDSIPAVAASANDAPYLTVNVDVTDAGIQPSAIYLPVGRSILLVMRNRGVSEHHYHVSGLVPADMLWLSNQGDATDTDAEDHSEHDHGGAMVPYHICVSGVCPTGNDVHTHAMAGDMDAILFTTTAAGTFTAQDPLHPEITGKVIVY